MSPYGLPPIFVAPADDPIDRHLSISFQDSCVNSGSFEITDVAITVGALHPAPVMAP